MTPKAISRRSKIHGWGVFAVSPIVTGETVCVFGGVIVPTAEIENYWKSVEHDIGIQVSDRFFVCPSSFQDAKRTGVFNHSCSPNIGLSDSVTAVAVRDIGKGEELVIDYGTALTVGEPMRCLCRSPNCRKTINPTDWKLPEVQKNRKWFSPYLKHKLRRETVGKEGRRLK